MVTQSIWTPSKKPSHDQGTQAATTIILISQAVDYEVHSVERPLNRCCFWISVRSTTNAQPTDYEIYSVDRPLNRGYFWIHVRSTDCNAQSTAPNASPTEHDCCA